MKKKAIISVYNKEGIVEFAKELDYVFLQNEKGKIFLMTKDVSRIDFENLKMEFFLFSKNIF